MEVVYLPKAKKDLEFWVKSGDKAALRKISELVLSIQETPFEGIGKPEGLKHGLSGLWSRRIDREHRFVYEIDEDKIFIYSLKGHYTSWFFPFTRKSIGSTAALVDYFPQSVDCT